MAENQYKQPHHTPCNTIVEGHTVILTTNTTERTTRVVSYQVSQSSLFRDFDFTEERSPRKISQQRSREEHVHTCETDDHSRRSSTEIFESYRSCEEKLCGTRADENFRMTEQPLVGQRPQHEKSNKKMSRKKKVISKILCSTKPRFFSRTRGRIACLFLLRQKNRTQAIHQKMY